MKNAGLVRLIVLAVALFNQSLVMAGNNPLPFASEDIELFVANAFTVVAAFVAWYKHNFVTKKQKESLK